MIRILTPFLVFFLPIDLEFSVGAISGDGERLGHSMVMVGDVLVPRTESELGVKLSDLVALALFLILFVKVLQAIINGKRDFLRLVDFRIYGYLLAFVILSCVILFWNSDHLTESQFISSLSYLAKFTEVSLFFVFFIYYFRTGGDPRNIYKALILSSFFAASAGIINPFLDIFSGWLIPDRVEFYGMQVLICVLLTTLLLSNVSVKAVTGVSRKVLWLIVVLLVVSILLCGKRTVSLGLIVGMSYLFIRTLSTRNFLNFSLFAGVVFLFGWDSLFEQFNRTFSGHTYLGEGLNEQHSSAISGSIFDGLYGLDLSSADRFARLLVGIEYFTDHPVFGVGFMSSQYIYNFLPDSIFQVLIETGLIGGLLLAWPVILTWNQSGRFSTSVGCNRTNMIAWKSVVVSLLFMGMVANVVYIYKLVAVFLLVSSLARQRLVLPKKRRVIVALPGSSP